MKQGEKVCISVKALFDEYGENLERTEIRHTSDGENEYYDLYDPFFGLLCADGEECTICAIDGENVMLENQNGTISSYFWLTTQELQTAVFAENE